MSAVLGASVGAGGVRGIVRDTARDRPESVETASVDTTPAPSGLAPDPWDAIVDAVGSLAYRFQSDVTVLALREENPTDAYSRESAAGMVLTSELGAQLRAVNEAGELAGERTVALLDLGASGVSISVVDSETGQVLLSERTDLLAGDRCDYLLGEYLVTTFGAAEALTGEVRRQLTTDMRDIKEHLTVERSVTLAGPFVGGQAALTRNDLDDVVRQDLKQIVDMVAWALDTVGVQVDALVTVGGGANMQTVRQGLFDAFTLPIFTPYEPQLLAARGAASIAVELARPVAVAPEPEPEPERPVAPVLPRHSDSARRKNSARRLRGRYLGGIVAAGVAGAVAVGIAAAANRDAEQVPSAVLSTVVDSSPVAVPQFPGGLPVSLSTTSSSAPTSASLTTEPVPTSTEASSGVSSEASNEQDGDAAAAATPSNGRSPRTTSVTTTAAPTTASPTRTTSEHTAAPPAPVTTPPTTAAPTSASPTKVVTPTRPAPTTTRRP